MGQECSERYEMNHRHVAVMFQASDDALHRPVAVRYRPANEHTMAIVLLTNIRFISMTNTPFLECAILGGTLPQRSASFWNSNTTTKIAYMRKKSSAWICILIDTWYNLFRYIDTYNHFYQAKDTHMDQENRYAILKAHVKKAGLLEKQPIFYIFYALLIVGFWTLGIYVLSNGIMFLSLLTGTLILAFASAQTALLSHDVGHEQVTTQKYRPIIDAIITLTLGLSVSWWRPKHNLHHAYPSKEGVDPDVNIPLLSFFEKQNKEKSGIARITAAYQHVLFLPMLLFEIWHMRIAAIRYLMPRGKGKNSKHIYECTLILFHLIAYVAFWLLVVSPLYALLFMFIHHGVMGVYLGLVFATNHKGMPTFRETSDFVDMQVLTARNVRGGRLLFFLFGGLNFQIEHHLFSKAPRNQLRRIQKIVKAFCAEQGIPYCEMSLFASYWQVYLYLKNVSAPLRIRNE